MHAVTHDASCRPDDMIVLPGKGMTDADASMFAGMVNSPLHYNNRDGEQG